MVLFGAGASYGSGSVSPYCTPLGHELYNELKTYFPLTWGRLDPYYVRQFNNNFEMGMQSMFENDYPLHFQLLMRNLAEYFCEFHPTDDSNLYVQFLSQIKNINTIFSSLNYDLLFENAIQRLGSRANHYLGQNGDVVFLKLHGSCNFIPQGVTFNNVTFSGRNLIALDLTAVDTQEVLSFCHSGTSVYPAMCLYMESKPAQFGENKMKEIQKKWAEFIFKAERVLIVGVRPYLQDKHVWQPLSETNAKIGYIGSKMAFDNWTDEFRSNKENVFIANRWCTHLIESVNFLKM